MFKLVKEYITICLCNRIYFILFFVICSNAQGLLLPLNSGITPGNNRESVWDTKIELVRCMQGKCPTTCILNGQEDLENSSLKR